jgi:integrase
MNDDVYSLLLEFRDLGPDEKIFRDEFQNFCIDKFYPLQEKAGVQRITFHDLRHTFASLLAMSGLSAFDIQMLLGHSDLKTTMRYMHLAPGHLRGKTDMLLRKPEEKNPTDQSSRIDMLEKQKFAIERNIMEGVEKNECAMAL